MRKVAIVVAYLVHAGDGWYLQKSTESSRSSPHEVTPLLLADGDLRPLKMLAALLLEFKMASAFMPAASRLPYAVGKACFCDFHRRVSSGNLNLLRENLKRGSLVQMATSVVGDPKVDDLQGIKVQLPPALNDEVWSQAFRGLVTNDVFVSHGWSQRAFKLTDQWSFADGAYTMDQVRDDVTLLPPNWVAGSVIVNNGSYAQPMQPGFTAEDVGQRMESGTISMLNAGFMVPSLARVSLAMLEATCMPIWTNVYVSRPGLSCSLRLHTDLQDVLLVQTSGRKRWRVYSPPPPAEAPFENPFARGKGFDRIVGSPEQLLVDTVMEPGQVLYIPAGFPHETDTLEAGAKDGFNDLKTDIPEDSDKDPSIHLTIGVDTHLWGLSWAKMRELALRRAKLPATLESGLPVNTLPLERWSLLHAPLPVGFAASQLHAREGAKTAGSVTEEGLAAELASRLASAEPERWADAAAVEAQLPVREAAAVMLSHYRRVLELQRRMYERAEKGPVKTHAVEGGMDELDEAMQSLEDWAEGKNIATVAPPKTGFGASAAGKGNAKSKSKAKRRKKR